MFPANRNLLRPRPANMVGWWIIILCPARNFWQKGLLTGYKFRRQHPIGIYYLDFFCEEAALNVELDGSQHGFPDRRKHDTEREKFLKSRGIKTLRFWNSHLRRNAQSIRDTIFNELQARAPHSLPEFTRPMKPEKKS